MSKLIYIPLEHIDGRYTVHMDRDIENHLLKEGIDYVKIMPDIDPGPLPKGMFLNAPFTTRFKSMQLATIAQMYEQGNINDTDRFFFSDIWFPGIESIAYMNYFTKTNAKITGVIHAGSFTDTDFVRDMERWAKNFEDIIFDISDTVYCASHFLRNDLLKKRFCHKDQLVVSGLPLDFQELDKHRGVPKEDIVIFNGRLCDEKQPWMFDNLEKSIRLLSNVNPKTQFIKTQELNLSKSEYYKLLARSKVVVSYALQENFGFGIAEAAYLGCVPVVPDRLVYPELYPSKFLFQTFNESVYKVIDALHQDSYTYFTVNNDCMNVWFGKDK